MTTIEAPSLPRGTSGQNVGRPIDRVDGTGQDHRRRALRRRVPVPRPRARRARARDHQPRADHRHRHRRGVRRPGRHRRAHPPQRARAEARAVAEPDEPEHARVRHVGELPQHRRGALERPAGRGRRRRDARRRPRGRRPGPRPRTPSCRRRWTSPPRSTTPSPRRATRSSRAARSKGDAEAALAAAPVSVDLRFTTPPHHHNAIEPHATTAVWDGDRLTVHDATQNIDWLRRHLALPLRRAAARRSG